MLKMRKVLFAIAGGAALFVSAPASAGTHVWMYYGGYGELVGYKIVDDFGTVCVEEGYQSSSVDYYYIPDGENCTP